MRPGVFFVGGKTPSNESFFLRLSSAPLGAGAFPFCFACDFRRHAIR